MRACLSHRYHGKRDKKHLIIINDNATSRRSEHHHLINWYMTLSAAIFNFLGIIRTEIVIA
ncbi:hypothetical protein BSTEL_1365 [Bifidobacterium stellenboschense]|uniref:Uncharacterized protein n=1 Tax=Bifidobacterium stellenboschense TaxID=762211 RepID=A0A087DU87_9BIFI|nr:hypothetical protein BSTEL_1365 [Bifidobacterium stellenboschense]